MESIIANAVAVAHRAVEQLDGAAAMIRVRDQDVPITVTPGTRTTEDGGADAVVYADTTHEWLLNPEELFTVDGNPFKPEAGQLIILEDGSTYRVAYYDANNCWQWNDHTRQRLRVYTVEQQPTTIDP